MAGIIVVVCAGQYVYTTIPWIEWTPTSWLLAYQGAATSQATEELVRRYKGGTLAAAETDAMFENALEVSLNFRTPHPAGQPVRMYLDAAVKLPPLSDYLFDDGLSVSVDGITHEFSPLSGSGSAGVSPEGMTIQLPFDVPGLDPGTRQITVSLLLGIGPGGSWNPLPRVHQWSRSVTKEIVIEDRPISEFVKPIWNADLASAARKHLKLSIWGDSTTARRAVIEMQVAVLDFPSPIAYDVWSRPSGWEEYHKTNVLFLARAGGWRAHQWHVPRDSGWEGAERFDLRLVPSAKAAFNAGLDSYFDGIVEWHGIGCGPRTNVFTDEDDGTPPSRVIRASASPARGDGE